MEGITKQVIEYYIVQKVNETGEENPLYYNQAIGNYSPTTAFEYATSYTDDTRASKAAKLLAALAELDEALEGKFEYKLFKRTITGEYVEQE